MSLTESIGKTLKKQKMKNPTDMNAERNEHFRFFWKFSRESILIILTAICVIVTTGTHFRMNGVVDSMADIKAGYEVNIRNMIDSNDAKAMEYRLLQNKVARYEADLHAKDN